METTTGGLKTRQGMETTTADGNNCCGDTKHGNGWKQRQRMETTAWMEDKARTAGYETAADGMENEPRG